MDLDNELDTDGPWGPWSIDGVTLSMEQRRAVTDILRGDAMVTVLTGKAGVGKSIVVQFLRETGLVTVSATTGKAAVSVGGITIDSLMAFNRETGSCFNEDYLDYQMRLAQDIVLIDEASMNSTAMARAIYKTAKAYGKRVVLVGDWAQAAPVVPEARQLRQLNPDADPIWPFGTELFKDYTFIRLEECHRQSDMAFLEVLNKVRLGIVDEQVNEIFGAREYLGEHPFFDAKCLRMFAINKSTDFYNNQQLMKLCRERQYTPDQLQIHFTPGFKKYDEQSIQRIRENSPFGDCQICIDARVIFTRNEQPSTSRRYVNGDQGHIVDIRRDQRGEIDRLEIHMDRHQRSISVDICELDVCDLRDRVLYTLRGFPIRLGWAMTVHKSQGCTAEYVWFDMCGLSAMAYHGGQAALHGLAYVGLSRCRRLENLYLPRWRPDLVYCDPKVRHLL